MKPQSLLGRAHELDVVDRLIHSSDGSALTVLGEPGIGKSALLAEVDRRATHVGYRVLRAAGVESEMHLPFGGLQQLMSPLMGHTQTLPPIQRDALNTALGLFDGPRPDLFLIAAAALHVLVEERRARRVLVIADDLQWLDPQSHQIVTFLGHRAEANDLLVIGATRNGHPGPFANGPFAVLELAGLEDAAAESILQLNARELTPANRARIRREARGNPLALLELPSVWRDGSSPDDQSLPLTSRLERAFAGRIGHFAPQTRDFLLVAAINSGNDLDEIVSACSALRVQPPHVLAGEPAEEAGLIAISDGTVSFRHPLVRSGVLQMETVARRQHAHQSLAAVLGGDRYRQTWHRAQSIVGPDDAVADELEATVALSLRRGAVMSSVSVLERAAQLSNSSAGRGRRLIQAAEHAFEVGQADVVARLIREAAGTDLLELDLVRMDRLKESLNDDVRADPGRVVELCASAGIAATSGNVDLALDILILAALRCWWADVGASARAVVIETLLGLSVAPHDARYLCVLAITEPVTRATDVTQLLSEVALDEVTDAHALRTFGMAAYGVGNHPLATDLLDRSEQLLRSEGRLGLLPVVLALQFHIRLDLGDWAGSAAASQEVSRVAVETGQSLFAFNNVLVESRGLALRGEWQAALDMVIGAEDEASRLRINDAMCLGFQTRGAAYLSADRPTEAFEILRRQFDPADPGYHLRESFAGVSLLVESAVESGNVEEARAIVRTMTQVARITPAPMLHVNLLYATAVLAEQDKAGGLFKAALERDLERWPWVEARLRLEYGRWFAGAGRAEEAGEQLDAALNTFTDLGAARWMRHTAYELDRLRALGPQAVTSAWRSEQ